MSLLSSRVFRGCRALLSPASKTSAATASAASGGRSTTSTGTKKPAAKAKAKAKARSTSPAANQTKLRTGGIFKEIPLSPALAQFLGANEASRADAVKQIWSYIKTHNLQNPTNKKEILCDEKLKPLFEGKDKVGFLEIGKLLSPHFVKTN